jgi:hypothetical protein
LKTTLINAIVNRECLSVTYGGLQRIIQPVAVGISRAGNEVLRCYQIAGGHIASGHDWDLLDLSKITGLSTTGKHFQDNPPGYRRGDKGMTTIYAQL